MDRFRWTQRDRWFVAGLSCFTVLLAAHAQGAAPPSDPAAEIFTSPRLNAIVRDAIPVVEYLAGRKFRSPPRVIFCSPEAFGIPLQTELAMTDRLRAPGGAYPANITRARVRMLTQSLLGKYFFNEGTLRVVPSNVVNSLLAMNIPMEHAVEAVRLVVIHELAHALHDQHGELRQRLLGVSNTGELTAFHGITEGFATWIERRAHAWLELPSDLGKFTKFEERQGGGLRALDPGLSRDYEAAASASTSGYARGADYITRIYDQGGLDAVWKVILDPPPTADALWRGARKESGAATASAGDSPAIRLLTALATARGLNPGDGPGQLSTFEASLTGLGKDERETLLGMVQGAEVFSASDRIPNAKMRRRLDVRILSVDPARARQAVELLNADFHKAFLEGVEGRQSPLVLASNTALAVPGIEYGCRESITPRPDSGIVGGWERRVFAHRGRVAEFLTRGWDCEEAVWASLVQSMLRTQPPASPASSARPQP